MNNFLLLACDCDEPINTIEDFESGWQSSDFVLELRILGSSQKSDVELIESVVLEAEVIKIHKGKLSSRTIRIHTVYNGGGTCYFPFESGKAYLFYGIQSETGMFEASICNRTGELKDKSFDLKLLGEK